MENTQGLQGAVFNVVNGQDNVDVELLKNAPNVLDDRTTARRIIKVTADMDVSQFAIDKTEEYKSVSQIMDMVSNSMIKFNDPIQRNADAWSIQGKSLLIISLLEVVSIGEVTAQAMRTANKRLVRNMLDGKQRLTTIIAYVKNKFAIDTDHYVYGIDESGEKVWLDINGLYFKDLPEFYQKRILGTMIKIDLYDIDDEMKFELFRRRNNGVALKTAQLRKSLMDYNLLSNLVNLKELAIFRAGFSVKALNDDTHADMILQAMAVLLTKNNTALDNTALNNLLVNKAFTTEVMVETARIGNFLCEAMEYLDEKSFGKCFGKNKTIALVYLGKKALLEARSAKDFSNFMTQFFVKDYSKSGFASESGTAKLAKVQKRHEIAEKHYDKFFNPAPAVKSTVSGNKKLA